MILVFTGIQGCGKGTQARLLVEKYGFILLEMGQELRKLSSKSTKLGLKIKETLESGALVTSEIVGDIMKEVLQDKLDKNLILDGFVRNVGNKESIEKIVKDYKVVFFELSKDKAIERLLGRMYDSETGETFPFGTILNPNNGNKLIKRKDDNKEAILKRIEEFTNVTLLIVKKQEEEGKVIKINAEQSIENVANEVIEKLGLK